MKVLKKRDSSGILPLSCNPKLDQRNIPGIDAYFTDLSIAFKNPRIRNIAITGQHGVGKSSIIKSFDTAKRSVFGRKPKFLYVSVGKYHTTAHKEDVEEPLDDKHTYTGTLSDGTNEFKITINDSQKLSEIRENCRANKQDISEEQNAIERRLLLQLCSKFEDRYFPASGFRLIPKQPGFLSTFFFVLYSIALMLLTMKKLLSDLVLKWKPQGEIIEKLRDFILRWHECGEAILYAVAIIGTAVVFWKGFNWLCIRGKQSNFAVKTANAEWNLGENTYEGYLDQYTQELVYYLSRVSKKIDYTVVFEDMDRFDEELSIPIFMRLREINHLVNTHMDGDRCIRFVFVVKDSVALSLNYNKFFDFTLPIVPTLNKKSSEVIFRDYLKEVNEELARTIKKEHLRERVGSVGAGVVVFLNAHPVIKEMCCAVRNAVQLKTVKFVLYLLKKLAVGILKIISSIVLLLKGLFEFTFRIVRCLFYFLERISGKMLHCDTENIGVLSGIIKKYGSPFPDINKIPVLGCTARWLTRIKQGVREAGTKTKQLLCYRESVSDCKSCDHFMVRFNDNECIHRAADMDSKIIQTAAEFLTDYRKMFTVLNEYSLMVRLYLKTNPTRMTCDTTKQILAFQIYKHLFTDDYRRLVGENNEPNYLTTRSINEETEDRKTLLEELQKHLNLNSLDFAGFSRSKIAEIWKHRLEEGNALEVIEAMRKQKGYLNPDLVQIVQDYCKVSKSKKDDLDVQLLASAVSFSLDAPSANDDTFEWFSRDRNVCKCLCAITKIKDKEECKYKKFLERSLEFKKNGTHIFRGCCDYSDELPDQKLNKDMVTVYIAGVPDAKIVGKRINLMEGQVSMDEIRCKITQ